MSPTFFLIVWFVLPLPVWVALLLVRRRVGRVLVWIVCLTSMAAGVFVLANYVWALDAQLLAEIDTFEPGTPEAERAAEEWASDTDRSFLLLLSPVLTAVWYGVLFLSLFGLQRMLSQLFPATTNASDNSSIDIDNAEKRGDDGNPYQSPNVR